jgi:hypothetical protein
MDRTPALNLAARALRDLLGEDGAADLREQINNYGEGEGARAVLNALDLALHPACPRCRMPLNATGWCRHHDVEPPPYVTAVRETAYGRTERILPTRVF